MSVRSRFKNKHAGRPLPLNDDHRAVLDGTTMFPSRTRSAREVEHILIKGENNRKIGSHWAKGPWRGAAIYSLTLVERETCPRTCPVWASCMGNHEHWPMRIRPDRWLIPILREEVAFLTSYGLPISVRLHGLGDFYSTEYAKCWIDLAEQHSNLTLFGFTAHPRTSQIGSLIEQANRTWDRVRIRFSGSSGPRSSTVMIDPLAGRSGNSITCPAELARGKLASNCGSCGLCLTAQAQQIVFKLH